MSLTQTQLQALVHLVVTTQHRARGDRAWEEAGVAPEVRSLSDRGFSDDEIIDRALAHARDPKSRTPAAMRWPHGRPVTQVPTDVPPERLLEKCPTHPARPAHTCIDCAGDRLAREAAEEAQREEPPAYDEHGHRLRRRPLRELYEEAKAEQIPMTIPARETR